MSDTPVTLALQACLTCRRQKRKCSRELPSCLLCRKNRRRCEYTADGPSPSSVGTPDFVLSQTGAQTGFPALLFLDSYTFKRQRKEVQIPEINLPTEFLESFGSGEQVQHDVQLYFDSIHIFFPIISKLRIDHHLSSWMGSPSADTVLLVVAMRLMCRAHQANESSVVEFYDRAKRLYAYVERCNVFTIKLVQAGLLIALYEIANGIYPAAYLTVGNCSRVGQALGIHSRKPTIQILRPADSWTESEERRRVWWGVIILNRYISIGTGDHEFACEDAKPDALLPVDETSWDKGEPVLIQSLAVSASTSIPASPFTRTCQATHLLSRVLQHIRAEHSDAQIYYAEAKQLHFTVEAFGSALEHELRTIEISAGNSTAPLTLFTAIGVCFSAKIALYDNYTCADTDASGGIGTAEQLEMQQIALTSIKTTCIDVHTFAKRLLSGLQSVGLTAVSPLLCDCFYQAAMNYSWYIRETGQNELTEHLMDIMNVLRAMGSIWAVASKVA